MTTPTAALALTLTAALTAAGIGAWLARHRPPTRQPDWGPDPDWGPNLTDCPNCNGATMSPAAMAEHQRVRHGDS